MKNAVITEAETVNAGTKFIIRNIAQQEGEHTKSLFRWHRSKAEIHTRRGRMWASPCEEHNKGAVKSFIRSVLLGLCLPSRQLSDFFFHIWPTIEASPGFASQSEVFWEEQDSLRPGFIPWLLTHKEPFCTCVVSLLPQKEGSEDPLIFYSNRVLPLFVLAMTITLTIAMTLTLRCLQETGEWSHSVVSDSLPPHGL